MTKKKIDTRGMSKDNMYLVDEICCYRPAENEQLRSPHVASWTAIPNIMDHLYYTPTIHDFYVGFEYECKLNNGEWDSIIFQPNEFSFADKFKEENYFINGQNVRVKYLDIEDVESFDFKLIEEEEEFLLFESYKTFLGAGTGDDRKLVISYNTRSEKIWVWWKENRGTEVTIHEGFCKNKSDFRKLLKEQLRIPHLNYE
jgi:hypothetical protein